MEGGTLNPDWSLTDDKIRAEQFLKGEAIEGSMKNPKSNALPFIEIFTFYNGIHLFYFVISTPILHM